MRKVRKLLSFILVVSLCFSTVNVCFAEPIEAVPYRVNNAISETAYYLLKSVESPGVGSIGGEWTVLGMARSGVLVPQSWYGSYYEVLLHTLKEMNGNLHERKYTEYSRVILALTSLGKDPRNVGGHNILEKLGDYKKVVWQGINGLVYALIAIDSRSYEIPFCKDAEIQTTRKLLIDSIIARQLKDGGFSISGTASDPEMTAMVLQALAPYAEICKVRKAVESALNYLSKIQNENGGFASLGVKSLEGTVQVMVALTALGIDPLKNEAFIKNGNSVIENVMSFYIPGGGFKHVAEDKEANAMATEQGFYGLVAYRRYLNGEKSLFDMNDFKTEEPAYEAEGMSGNNIDKDGI